jgi:transcriptional regulator with XRE-family HTH domain
MKNTENKNDTAHAVPVTLGGTIRQAREQRNMSVRGLADQLHMNQSYISRVERGDYRQPSPEKLYQIANLLDLNYHDLCALAGYQAPGLPGFLPYLRAKYEITDEDARSLSKYFERLREKHGITEKTKR